MTASLLLASASPRRRQILAKLGLPYTVAVAPGDEDAAQKRYQGPIDGLAQWTAAYKALMMFTQPEAANHVIITSDTTVILDQKQLGKPQDAEQARQMLRELRGRWHRVVTAVVVSRLVEGRLEVHGESCSTPVLMRNYSDDELEAYVATGDPMDKAGAYSIQHPTFQPAEQIAGCYLNVVGLPLCTLVRLLARTSIYPAQAQGENPDPRHCPWSKHCQIDTKTQCNNDKSQGSL